MRSRRSTLSWSTRLIAVLTVAMIAAPTVSTAQVKQQGKAAAGGNAAAIAAVKAALDKYKDPIAAVRDGYFSTVGCIDFPAGGSEHGSMEYKPGAMRSEERRVGKE